MSIDKAVVPPEFSFRPSGVRPRLRSGPCRITRRTQSTVTASAGKSIVHQVAPAAA